MLQKNGTARLVALLLSSALPVALQAQVTPATSASAPRTAALKAPPTQDSLNSISWRGSILAGYDFAAWRSTDSVLARRPGESVIETYVAREDRSTGRWRVAFGKLSVNRDTFLVAYETYQMEAPKWREFAVEAFAPAKPDTGFWLRAARAIDVARKDFGPVTRPYNTAVIQRNAGGIWVYVMPAQTRHGVYPIGGDVRYLVSTDGRTIMEKRRMHREIIEYSGQPNQGTAKMEASFRVAVMDDIPEDTDVFHVMVRQPRLTEYIVTDSFVYSIRDNGEIKLLGRREEILGNDEPARKPNR